MIGLIIKKYKIEKLIGKGGMAKVYKARHIEKGYVVAIKILDEQLARNKKFVIRFSNEAMVMAKLNHINIIKVYDYIQTNRVNAIVMEYIEGDSLTSYVQTHSVEQRIEVFIQLLQAIDFAHKNGVIHRDLKPDNIIITPQNVIKVLDFGIAKMSDSDASLTQTGTQMGTPIFMSPEQVKDSKNIDNLSDIYSLGVVFYYILSKELPYNKNKISKYDILNKIVKEPLPRLTKHLAFNKIISKATHKNPANRYLRCQDFADDVYNEFVDLNKQPLGLYNDPDEYIETVVASPPPPDQKTTISNKKRTIKKKRTPVKKKKSRFGLIVLLTIIGFGLGYLGYFYYLKNNERIVVIPQKGIDKARIILPYKTDHNKMFVVFSNHKKNNGMFVSAVITNENGEIVKKINQLNGTSDVEIKTAIKINNGYLLGGYKMDKNLVGHAWVAQYSNNLSFQWKSNLFDDEDWSVVYGLTPANYKKEFIATGRKKVFNYVYKTDKYGDSDIETVNQDELFIQSFQFDQKSKKLRLKKQYIYWTPDYHVSAGYDITSAHNSNGYIITGYIFNHQDDHKNRDVLVLKTNNHLELAWTKVFGNIGTEKGFKVIKGMFDNYIIGGYTSSYGTDGDALLLNIDDNGEIIWSKYYNADGKNEVLSAKKLNNTYMFSGYTIIDRQKKAWFLNINNSGKILESKIIQAENEQISQDFINLGNDNFISVGYQKNKQTKTDILIYKFNK